MGRNNTYDASNFRNTEDNFLNDDEMKQFFKDLRTKCKEQILEADMQMRERNRAFGGVPHHFEKHDLIYVRDFRLLPKKKYKQKFFSSPHIVLKDFGQSLLIKNFQGITQVVHKQNVRPCPIRHAEQFQALPIAVKNVLGYEFTQEQMQNAILEGKVPEFFKDKEIKYTPPTTRSRFQANATEDEPDQDKETPETADTESDSDSEPFDQTNTPTTNKTVSFNI